MESVEFLKNKMQHPSWVSKGEYIVKRELDTFVREVGHDLGNGIGDNNIQGEGADQGKEGGLMIELMEAKEGTVGEVHRTEEDEYDSDDSESSEDEIFDW